MAVPFPHRLTPGVRSEGRQPVYDVAEDLAPALLEAPRQLGTLLDD